MRVIDAVTRAGQGRANEDRMGSAGRLAWVIDGATDLENDAFLPATSDVQWLVDRLGELLGAAGDAFAGDPRALLDKVSRRIRDEIGALGFPPGRIHPTCSVGLAGVADGVLHLARVGDPTCLAFGAERLELATDFFGGRERRAVAEAGGGGLNDAAARRGIVERRGRYIRGEFAESVFSGDPGAVLRVHSGRVVVGAVGHALLCTDGFARAVVDYGLYRDWDQLLDHALAAGLAAVLGRVREHEGRAPDGGGTHFKGSDDATALLLRP